MDTEVEVGDLKVEVIRKDIKNIHLSVHPPLGSVRVAAPLRMSLDAIRVFALSKLSWIKGQQKKIQSQEREPSREFLDHESHYVWGKRYLLTISETDKIPMVELTAKFLVFHVRPGTSKLKMAAILEGWYRKELRAAALDLVAKWEPLLSVKVGSIFIQKMKTKWGACVPENRSLRFNTELARKPPEFLEYVVIHEMVHLLVPSHSARFTELMDHFMPSWRQCRDELNRLPLRQEIWS